MFRSVALFCVYMALTPFLVNALTAEQKAKIHEHFETVGIKCIQENAISEEDMGDLRAKKVPAGPNAPCFLACMMKEIGVMDAKGMLQHEAVLGLAKDFFPDPEELKAAEDFLHSCASVNDEPVSDGDKGCEKALQAYKCMTKNALKFGFDI